MVNGVATASGLSSAHDWYIGNIQRTDHRSWPHIGVCGHRVRDSKWRRAAASLSASGAATVGSLSSASSLTIAGSSQLVGTLLLGGDAPFTVGRAMPTAARGPGRSTFVLGQRSNGASAGGDLHIDAGTGGTAAGSLLLGAASQAITIGVSGKTVSVLSHMDAAAAAFTGASLRDSLSSAGAVAGASISTSGTAVHVGSLILGTDSYYTIGRARASTQHGLTTFILGQAGAAGSLGGDIAIDAGTGTSSGRVLVGPAASAVVLGSLSGAVSVAGSLTGSAASFSGTLQAAHLTTAGTVSASALSAGTATVSGALTVGGSASVAADVLAGGAVSAAGVVTAAGGLSSAFIQTAGSLSAGSATITNNVNVASLTASGSISAAALSAGSLSAGLLTATGLTSSGSLSAASGITTAGTVTAAAVSATTITASAITARSLSVSAAATVVGNLQVGADLVYTVGRPAPLHRQCRSQCLRGQAAGVAGSNGGDMHIDAGTGNVAGRVVLGGSSEGVTIGRSGKSVDLPGANTGKRVGHWFVGCLRY